MAKLEMAKLENGVTFFLRKKVSQPSSTEVFGAGRILILHYPDSSHLAVGVGCAIGVDLQSHSLDLKDSGSPQQFLQYRRRFRRRRRFKILLTREKMGKLLPIQTCL